MLVIHFILYLDLRYLLPQQQLFGTVQDIQTLYYSSFKSEKQKSDATDTYIINSFVFYLFLQFLLIQF